MGFPKRLAWIPIQDDTRAPNKTGAPNKSVEGIFFLKINYTGGYSINKKLWNMACSKENIQRRIRFVTLECLSISTIIALMPNMYISSYNSCINYSFFDVYFYLIRLWEH